MIHEGVGPRVEPTQVDYTIWRAVGLVVIALAELLLLTIRFDTGSLRSSGAIAALIENASFLPQLVAVFFSGSLIFGSQELMRGWQAASRQALGSKQWVSWLIVHVCLYVAFFLTTGHVFEVTRGASPLANYLWLMLALVCGLTWCCSVIPPSQWLGTGKLLAPVGVFVLLIALACWLGGRLAEQAWASLAMVTFQSVSFLLTLTGYEVVCNPQTLELGTQDFSVIVAPACSGLEGIGLATVFVVSYLCWCRKQLQFPKAWLLLPAAIAAMFITNLLRITTLICLGACGYKEFALGGFHSQAGWLAFNVVTLGLIAVTRKHLIKSECAPVNAVSKRTSATPMLMPFIALTLTVIISEAIVPRASWNYSLRLIAVVGVLYLYRDFYRKLTWTRPSHVGALAGVLTYLIWIALEPADSSLNAKPDLPSYWLLACGWYFARVIGSVVTVPIAEELAFRGYLLPLLSPGADNHPQQLRASSWKVMLVPLLLSSIIFGILHPGRVVAGSIAGVLFGVVYLRSRSLTDSIIAHAIANALIAVHVLMLGRWSLWN